mmetsp:Transcript_11727/g.26168  ORF Transcript_11727/g.26168 Transcript_11727/m.26168 type:complete len:351 (-) Transcript_11727:32-1084(-)
MPRNRPWGSALDAAALQHCWLPEAYGGAPLVVARPVVKSSSLPALQGCASPLAFTSKPAATAVVTPQRRRQKMLPQSASMALRGRLAATSLLPQDLRTECLEQLDAIIQKGLTQPCPAWVTALGPCAPRVSSDRSASTLSEASEASGSAALVSSGGADEPGCQSEEQRSIRSFGSVSSRSLEEPLHRTLGLFDVRLETQEVIRRKPALQRRRSSAWDRSGNDAAPASPASEPHWGLRQGKGTRQSLIPEWGSPAHRNRNDLFWLERAAEVEPGPVKCGSTNSGGGLGFLTCRDASAPPLPVLLTEAEARRTVMRLLQASSVEGDSEAGSGNAEWRLHSLEKVSLRHATKT